MTSISRAYPIALAGLFMLGGQTALAGGAVRPVVVELYTSQGCDTCPPADAFLGKLAQRRDVIALSLPITYWDMLGWKDTLASDANTRRQKAYAEAMGHGGVYTPQIIVDGAMDVVGSRIANVEAAIDARQQSIETNAALADAHSADVTVTAARVASIANTVPAAIQQPPAAPAPPSLAVPPHGVDPVIPVSVVENRQEMRIRIGAADGQHNATVWMFHIRSAVNVNIKAGENEGHAITYHNVVADLRAVGVWKGDSLSLTLPRSAMAGLPHDGVAVIVQQGGYGHVIGAAYLARPDYDPSH
jgi:hypothetical protein